MKLSTNVLVLASGLVSGVLDGGASSSSCCCGLLLLVLPSGPGLVSWFLAAQSLAFVMVMSSERHGMEDSVRSASAFCVLRAQGFMDWS